MCVEDPSGSVRGCARSLRSSGAPAHAVLRGGDVTLVLSEMWWSSGSTCGPPHLDLVEWLRDADGVRPGALRYEVFTDAQDGWIAGSQ